MNNYVTTKIVVPIDSVQPNTVNPNVMSKSTFEKLKKNFQEKGFYGSVIVREHIVEGYYEILDGEHRWKAAKELGWTEIPVENAGKISDDELKFHTINFNNARGKDDVFKLAEIMSELDEGQQQLLPWTADEIEHTTKLIEFDFSQYNKESELPERTPGMLVVLPFNAEESQVWLKVKETLVEKGFIGTDNSKKKQDIQIVMWLAKNILGITLGSNDTSDVIQFEATPEAEATIAAESVNTDKL